MTEHTPEITPHRTLFDPQVFTIFVHPGEIVEVRSINGKSVTAGYFDNHEAFCKAVRAIDRMGGNVYFTLQVIDPRLIARANNRTKPGIATTSDKDVLFYRWLPVDTDPVRPSGISSSDPELEEARLIMEEVVVWLQAEMGFSRPIAAMSGNGCHALYRLPDLANTPQNRDFIKGILETLDERFSTSRVSIDTTVFNPARIWKLYGTTARKGDELPATEYREARPHRESFIESLGGAE